MVHPFHIYHMIMDSHKLLVRQLLVLLHAQDKVPGNNEIVPLTKSALTLHISKIVRSVRKKQ